MSRKIKKGDAYLVNLDPIIGAEIGKIRPAVIISNDINNTYADTVTIVPVTSNIDKIYPFEVLIDKGEAGNTTDSKVKCNQIRTIDKRRLYKNIGTLKEETIKQIEQAILIHLGISY